MVALSIIAYREPSRLRQSSVRGEGLLSSGVKEGVKAEVMARMHDHIVMYKRIGMTNFLWWRVHC
jgi:hypothetical protein